METSPAPTSVLPSSSLVPCSRAFEVRCQGRPNRPKSVGLFAVSSLPANFTFHEELPVFALQQAVNKSLVRACCNCHKVLGDLHSQLAHFFSSTNPEALDRLKTCAVNSTSLPNPAFSAEVVSCPGGCGEMYCCRSCQLTHMRQSHRYLCVGPLEEGHPIVLFKQLALQQTENLLLAVEAICKVVSLAAEDLMIHEHNVLESSGGAGTEVSRRSCPAEVNDAKFLRILAERESEVKAKTEQLFGVLLGYDHDYWEAMEEGDDEASKERLLVLQNICHCLHAAFSNPVNERQAGAKILANLFKSPDLLSQVTGLFEKTNTHIVVPSPLNAVFRNAAEEVRSSPSVVAQSNVELLEFILREKEVALQRIFGDDEEEEEDDEGEDSIAYKQRQKEKEHLMKTRFAGVSLGSLLPPSSERETSENSLNKVAGERSSFQPRSFPDVHGTGFFPSIGRMNHSCAPNVRLVYPHGSNTVAFVTMRPVNQGEELCISYVDGIEEMDDEERTAALDTFGFQCDCDRCRKPE